MLQRRKEAAGGQGRAEGFLEEGLTMLILKAECPSTSWATTPCPRSLHSRHTLTNSYPKKHSMFPVIESLLRQRPLQKCSFVRQKDRHRHIPTERLVHTSLPACEIPLCVRKAQLKSHSVHLHYHPQGRTVLPSSGFLQHTSGSKMPFTIW